MARSRNFNRLFANRRGRPSLAPLVVLLILALAAGYLAVFSPLFWVRNVTVEGTKALKPDAIKDYTVQAAQRQWGPIISQSLAVLKEPSVESSLKNHFPDLAEVTVTKHWPNSLTVSVTERQSTILWKTKDSYYLVDQQGIAYAPGTPGEKLLLVEDSAGVPVQIGQHLATDQFVKVLLDIQVQMQGIGVPVTSFRVPETTFEVQAVTGKGWYALFDTTRPIPTQVQALQLALKTQKPAEYADLRVPGRVYVK